MSTFCRITLLCYSFRYSSGGGLQSVIMVLSCTEGGLQSVNVILSGNGEGLQTVIVILSGTGGGLQSVIGYSLTLEEG